MNAITREKIQELAVVHLARYSGRLEQAKLGKPGYNLNECRYYLGLWKSMEQKGFDQSQFSDEEVSEMVDAYEDSL